MTLTCISHIFRALSHNIYTISEHVCEREGEKRGGEDLSALMPLKRERVLKRPYSDRVIGARRDGQCFSSASCARWHLKECLMALESSSRARETCCSGVLPFITRLFHKGKKVVHS